MEAEIDTPAGSADLEALALSAQLHSKSVRGMAIVLPAQCGKAVVHLGSLCVLSRLLAPEEFGVLGMVMTVTGFLELFKDVGLGTAIIQRKHLDAGLVGMLFVIVAAVSLLLAGMILVSGPYLSIFYHEPRVVELTPLVAMAVLASGLAVVPQALCRRELFYGRLAVVDLVSPCLGVAAGVATAKLGHGVQALAMQLAVTSVVAAVLNWCISPRWPDRPKWSPAVREALFFGGNLSGFTFVNYWARNLDNILIGRVWGAVALGVYSRAYALLLAPMSLVNTPLSSVFIPTLSRLQNRPQEVRSHYLRGLGTATSLTLPLSAVLVICSNEIVRLALGSGWDDVDQVFGLLALSAGCQFIGNTTGWLYTALGNTSRLLRWGIFSSSLLVCSFIVGLPYGPRGVALAYSLTMIALIVPNLWYTTRGTAITLTDIGLCCIPAALAAVACGTVSLLCKSLLADLSIVWLRDLLVLMCGGIAVLVAFGLTQAYRSGWRGRFGSSADDPEPGSIDDAVDMPAAGGSIQQPAIARTATELSALFTKFFPRSMTSRRRPPLPKTNSQSPLFAAGSCVETVPATSRSNP